jgi:hypothetical protein
MPFLRYLNQFSSVCDTFKVGRMLDRDILNFNVVTTPPANQAVFFIALSPVNLH